MQDGNYTHTTLRIKGYLYHLVRKSKGHLGVRPILSDQSDIYLTMAATAAGRTTTVPTKNKIAHVNPRTVT